MWIDVHTHLNMLEISVPEALALAKANQVLKVITISTDPVDMSWVVETARQNRGQVYCTVGIHPTDAQTYTDDVGANMRRYSSEPFVVALGEMGLDFYHSNATKDVQLQVFRKQLELAVETGLPVEIHTREAEADTVALLKEFGGEVEGLLHCFTGTQWLADEALALGLNISISGVVTFKNAQALRDVVTTIPLDRLHVETDAPFLAPTPHRGKKNHPAFVIHTAEVVAGLKGVTVAELQQHTTRNAEKLFPKLRQ
jgi:TatD DNase family protein